MATIYAPSSPVARCSQCGVQRQFHAASSVPLSADRDHEFIAETIDDFDPGDLSLKQLVDAIDKAARRWTKLLSQDRLTEAEWTESDRCDARVKSCRTEMKSRVRAVFGVDWDELMGSIEG